MSQDDKIAAAVSTAAADIGSFIRAQREAAQVSLRQLADRAGVSNPYLSQIERDLHLPSLKVMQSIAVALDIPAADLLRQAGFAPSDDSVAEATESSGHVDTERAIKTDPRLNQAQREALLSVYRSFLAEG